jgi:hypothetical protein
MHIMKRRLFYILLPALAAFSCIFIVGCKDDAPGKDPAVGGSLHLDFNNVVGTEDLTLNSKTYQNSAGESFTVSILNYYISNIKLLKADGGSFIVPQDSSYFLIRESDEASQKATINHVPLGNYTGIRFLIGVDSTRSVADASKRKGILDTFSGPTNEEAMYWDWNPGYIFMKMEGSSPSATSPNGKYYYHIGGFGGRTENTINNLRSAQLNFTSAQVTVSEENDVTVGITADILKIFDGPTTLSIKENTSVMFTDFSTKIADNYTGAFSFKQVWYTLKSK